MIGPRYRCLRSQEDLGSQVEKGVGREGKVLPEDRRVNERRTRNSPKEYLPDLLTKFGLLTKPWAHRHGCQTEPPGAAICQQLTAWTV